MLVLSVGNDREFSRKTADSIETPFGVVDLVQGPMNVVTGRGANFRTGGELGGAMYIMYSENAASVGQQTFVGDAACFQLTL